MDSSPTPTVTRLRSESPRECPRQPRAGKTRQSRPKHRDKDERKRRSKPAPTAADPRWRRKRDTQTEPSPSPSSSPPLSPRPYAPYDSPPRRMFANPNSLARAGPAMPARSVSPPAVLDAAVPGSAGINPIEDKGALLSAWDWAGDVDDGPNGFPWRDLCRVMTENDEYKRREKLHLEEIHRLTEHCAMLERRLGNQT